MSRKIYIAILLMVSLALLVACTPGAASEVEVAEVVEPEPEAESEATGVIVLADVSDEPAKKIARFQPLADYLAANLGEYGIGVGEVKIAADMDSMIAMLSNGEVDLYFDSSYPSLIISEASGAVPILRRWKGGAGEYHSVIFARADSGLTSLDDLPGKMLAMEDDGSTSGYMLPMAHFTSAGLTLAEKDSENSAVAADEVGYVFSGDDDNTLQWVIIGKVDAGVTDNLNFEELTENSDVELVILAETEALPRGLALVRPGMDPELQAAITALLAGLHEMEEGPEILETFKSTKFDEFPEGAEAALDRMRELYQLVQSSQ
ncbi:MAG: phosphate/phosphite/phosphonate ABC transporter substrate-binding protein [Anaerolineales bacterium]|nr:phosphate/phosphite/phosphonate ABC transporter substrate-binding protein [Chloroflexota bacterium]MBL6980890.1 phosphate/phosphite/phosphonate ABC transporter substrate-binding protein [Anaerolineales bacterium]